MNEEVQLLSPEDIDIIDLTQTYHCENTIQKVLNNYGFLVVRNHGVDLTLLDQCYQLSEQFFSLSESEKSLLDYRHVEQTEFSNIGYFPMKHETAVGQSLPDVKEFLHIGPEAESVWPQSIPHFKDSFTKLFKQLQHCGDQIMSMITATYNLDAQYIHGLVKNGDSILRSIHYPPVKADEKALRAAPHTGIQLLGLQPRTTHSGLQFCLPNGEWAALNNDFKDCLAINMGEMLAYLLPNIIKPTLHQVVNTQNNAHEAHRYCIVHFYHANLTKMLNAIDQKNPTIMAGQWLLKRLKELGYQI